MSKTTTQSIHARRAAIADRMAELAADAEHWNRTHPDEEPIVIDLNLEPEVAAALAKRMRYEGPRGKVIEGVLVGKIPAVLVNVETGERYDDAVRLKIRDDAGRVHTTVAMRPSSDPEVSDV